MKNFTKTSARGAGKIILLSGLVVGAVSVATGVFPVSARAGLVGPQIVSGRVGIQTEGDTTIIDNSSGAIINWKQFSIASGHEVDFEQASAASTVLNRVTGGTASEIMGRLISNGRVFLINPAGIAFGEGSVVNTAGLIASTLNITDADFEDGVYNFKGDSTAGVSNAGSIVVAPGGYALMFGAEVKNTGLISAKGGTVILAAGKSVDVTNLTNPELSFRVTAPEGEAENLGSIIASGGEAALRAAVVSNAGTVSTVAATPGGTILLEGSTSADVSGTLSSTGGRIIVKSDGVTRISGAITDPQGYLDTSGKEVNLTDSKISLKGGNWFFDPVNIELITGSNTPSYSYSGTTKTVSATSGSGTEQVSEGWINTELDMGINVTLEASGEIYNSGSISVTDTAPSSLTLIAPDITLSNSTFSLSNKPLGGVTDSFTADASNKLTLTDTSITADAINLNTGTLVQTGGLIKSGSNLLIDTISGSGTDTLSGEIISPQTTLISAGNINQTGGLITSTGTVASGSYATVVKGAATTIDGTVSGSSVNITNTGNTGLSVGGNITSSGNIKVSNASSSFWTDSYISGKITSTGGNINISTNNPLATSSKTDISSQTGSVLLSSQAGGLMSISGSISSATGTTIYTPNSSLSINQGSNIVSSGLGSEVTITGGFLAESGTLTAPGGVNLIADKYNVALFDGSHINATDGAVNITGVTGVDTVNPGQGTLSGKSVSIKSTGNGLIFINSALSSAGNINIDSASTSNPLDIYENITSTGGNVTIKSADTIDQTAGTVSSATGSVSLTGMKGISQTGGSLSAPGTISLSAPDGNLVSDITIGYNSKAAGYNNPVNTPNVQISSGNDVVLEKNSIIYIMGGKISVKTPLGSVTSDKGRLLSSPSGVSYRLSPDLSLSGMIERITGSEIILNPIPVIHITPAFAQQSNAGLIVVRKQPVITATTTTAGEQETASPGVQETDLSLMISSSDQEAATSQVSDTLSNLYNVIQIVDGVVLNNQPKKAG